VDLLCHDSERATGKVVCLRLVRSVEPLYRHQTLVGVFPLLRHSEDPSIDVSEPHVLDVQPNNSPVAREVFRSERCR